MQEKLALVELESNLLERPNEVSYLAARIRESDEIAKT